MRLCFDETFLTASDNGDVAGENDGLFHRGTRFLSRLVVTVDGRNVTVEDSELDDVSVTTRGHAAGARVTRTVAVAPGTLVIELDIVGDEPATVRIELASDYADVFELRGVPRLRRGAFMEPVVEAGSCVLGYEGLDDVARFTRVDADPHPQWSGTRATFRAEGRTRIELTATCGIGESPGMESAATTLSRAREERVRRRRQAARVETSDATLNRWIEQSMSDLQMLLADVGDTGLYPLAGIPWYATPFGRDGLITGLQTVWVDPQWAAGVLRFLAVHQATDVDPARDAQPGKVLHEFRRGEMAALGEIPYGRYYGSADATLLFVILTAETVRVTGDDDLLDELWDAVKLALRWMVVDGDPDEDALIEYAGSDSGLVHQGWKDSGDPVHHADGRPAPLPIAMAEIQGYAHRAWKAAAWMAERRGEDASGWLKMAERTRERFEEAFWCEDRGIYAMAVDGDSQPCCVISSNAGQALFGGIATRQRAERTAHALFSQPGFSGWGARTLGSGEARYEPRAYHNGSIWPHDNAMVAAGLARYGLKSEVARITDALRDVSAYWPRLPELFSGAPRSEGEGPGWIDVSCAPQAWAAGAVFQLLASCLGLEVDGRAGKIRLYQPVLPEETSWVRIRHLRVGAELVDLYLEGDSDSVDADVEGNVELEVIPEADPGRR